MHVKGNRLPQKFPFYSIIFDIHFSPIVNNASKVLYFPTRLVHSS